MHARVSLVQRLHPAILVKEVRPKPYFRQMGLVLVRRINFLNGIELLSLEMEALPDLAEPSTTQLLTF